jgi:hypothetical protein
MRIIASADAVLLLVSELQQISSFREGLFS